MIYDTLNNLPNYLGVSDNLDTVIEYIMARDITTLPAGRTRIEGGGHREHRHAPDLRQGTVPAARQSHYAGD